MARGRWNGGIIGPNLKVTTSSASGIFSLSEAQVDVSAGLIPSVPIPVIAEPQFNLTTLLLHGDSGNGNQNNTFLDESTNALTITRGGTATQGSFSPFSQTGWSNYFNGSTDYFTSSSISSLNFGSNSFTIEFWMWGIAGTLAPIIHQATYNSTGWSIWRYDNSGNATTTKLCFMLNGATFILATATGFTANAWTHVAISKTGTNAYIFINGISQGTSSSAPSTVTASSSPFRIWYIDSSSWNFTGYMDAGYISNLRILNGTALYTSNFTPSTAPLTAITNTQLLYCQSNRFVDNSTNALALTTAGTPSVQAFSPFASAAAYGVSTNGGSVYFNGSSDYLTLGTNPSAIGTGDFTAEAWVYLTVNQASTIYCAGQFRIHITSSTSISITQNGVVDINSTTTPNLLNSWNHVAWSRSGTTLRVFLNGALLTTVTGNSTNFTAGTTRIGIESNSLISPFAGYISNLRIISGTAVYTTTFTPPAAPVTAIANTQLLLNSTNAGVYDATAKNDIITAGTLQVSTSQSKFGGSSIYFSNTGDGMTIPANNLLSTFGAGNFTIEFWIRYTSTGAQRADLIRSTTWAIVDYDNGNLYWQNAYASNSLLYYNHGSLQDGNWHHVAVVRSATSTLTMYVDGTSIGSGTDTNVYNTNSAITIGISGSYGQFLGYMDDIRITKGYARYTSNFTPQTYAFLNQ